LPNFAHQNVNLSDGDGISSGRRQQLLTYVSAAHNKWAELWLLPSRTTHVLQAKDIWHGAINTD
jgi:hypothetical protein